MVRQCSDHRSHEGCRYGARCKLAHSKEEEHLESKHELYTYRSLVTQNAKTRFIRRIIYQKDQREAEANETWSTQANPRWWHNLQKPVQHLTWDNKDALSTVQYMVSPKADGVRKMLVCERSAGDIYLIGTNNKTPVQVAGAKGSTIRGFVLDTEEVILSSGDMLVVAFDVLAIDSSALSMLPMFGAWDCDTVSSLFLTKSQKVLAINSLEQRYQLLKDLVGTISMSHLIVKPLWPTSKTEFVWKMSSSLPYPVDGLIFVPMSAKKLTREKHLTFKWKPTDKLTIDVAVGSAFANEPSGKVFVPHLYGIWRGGHPTSSSDLGQVIHPEHAPFQVDCRNREVFVQVQGQHYDVFSDLLEREADIYLTNAEDLDAINRQRKLEKELWLQESRKCGNEECSCTEVLPSGNAVSHCILCGVLVVNTHEACLDCNGQVAKQARRESSVLVPPEDSAWAAHHIIEVCFDICTSTFRFIRIRRDRLVANSAEQIKYMLKLQLHPVGLSDLSFYSEESRARDISPLLPYRIPTKGKSKFKSLRDLHYGIKGTLYRLFGGNLIVDACCGGLHDKNSWEESGSKQVLAIDWDSEQLERAKERTQRACQGPSTAAIQIVHADFSQPCSLGKAVRAMLLTDTNDKSEKQADIQLLVNNDELHNAERIIDTVFCHFALHFFWATRETSSTFLQNLVPFLRDSGLFVLTYMRADIIREQQIVKILNDDGEVEFEAKSQQQDENVEVFVASIGKSHFESLIDHDEMKYRFSEAGMDHLITYSFDQLSQMVPHQQSDVLTKGEAEMSAMYSAAVFQKRRRKRETSISAFDTLPQVTVLKIYSFLLSKDLAKLRALSTTFRSEVDCLGDLDEAREWFNTNPKSVLYQDEAGLSSDRYGHKRIELSPCTIASFLRLGGELRPTVEDPDLLVERFRGWYENRYYSYGEYSD